jgi:hypothetical protein
VGTSNPGQSVGPILHEGVERRTGEVLHWSSQKIRRRFMLVAKDDDFPFEYHALFILDESKENPAPFDWTKSEMIQGCQYTDSYIHVVTMASEGTAQLQIFLEEYSHNPEYQWVVQIPLVLYKGNLLVRAVSGYDLKAELPPGNYKIVVAQTVLVEDDEEKGTIERIDIFFMPTPELLQKSEVLFIDPAFQEEQNMWQ